MLGPKQMKTQLAIAVSLAAFTAPALEVQVFNAHEDGVTVYLYWGEQPEIEQVLHYNYPIQGEFNETLANEVWGNIEWLKSPTWRHDFVISFNGFELWGRDFDNVSIQTDADYIARYELDQKDYGVELRWGKDVTSRVPDNGGALALMGLGLAALIAFRRGDI